MAESLVQGVSACVLSSMINGVFYQLSIETRFVEIGQYLAVLDNQAESKNVCTYFFFLLNLWQMGP